MPNLVTRLLGRLKGARSAPAASIVPAGPAASPDAGGPIMRTAPGRIFLVATGLLMALFLLARLVELPFVVDLLRRLLTAAWIALGLVILALAISRNRRAFLWRVRRKLILSYVFFGVVPVVLVTAFVLAGGVLVYVTVASYVFQEGYANTVEDVQQSAATTAIELARDPDSAQAAAERRYSNMAGTYPQLSIAIVALTGPRASGTGGRYPLVAAGPWSHTPPPTTVPDWLRSGGPFAGTLVYADGRPGGGPSLLIRAAVPTPDGTRMVIADLPVDATVVTRLRDRTGTTLGRFSVTGCGVRTSDAASTDAGGLWALFRETVAFLDCTRWEDGGRGSISINLTAPVAGIYNQIAAVNTTGLATNLGGSWQVFLQVLVLLGVLFLIVQGSALVMGALLARSITLAVHELFIGTERVQQGDFTHRIGITSRDQLGDLAASFNRMSASIEHLLHVQREKQRLDDELRIAREIQQSLLPISPPTMAGLEIADLCEPAREVGGDYYDFFELGPRRLGVLVADVSGKGTSAALYMAALKGLMLALSRMAASPRELLIEVNRRLTEHLDQRSFVTMTYATIDLDEGTLVSARAGHPPLIVAGADGQLDIVAPDGMILGLRLPGVGGRFEQILEEHTRPIAPGDVIVLYTDGITEAMDGAGELFGDDALARVVASQHELGAAGIRERVVREVKAFVGDAEPHDDMTMIVIKATGEAA